MKRIMEMKSDKYNPDPDIFDRVTKEQQEKSDKLVRDAKRAEERNKSRPRWKRFLGIR